MADAAVQCDPLPISYVSLDHTERLYQPVIHQEMDIESEMDDVSAEGKK
jgi:hypothetical protein